MPLRVVVDPALCQRTGYCVRVAPHLFRLDHSGPPRVAVREIGDEERTVLIEAEDLCPLRAISVADARGHSSE